MKEAEAIVKQECASSKLARLLAGTSFEIKFNSSLVKVISAEQLS